MASSQWFRAGSQHVRRWLQQTVRQRVTRTGFLFSFLTLGVALAAFATSQNLLFLLLAAMLSTLLVSGFISRLGLAGLELELLLPDHILAQQNVQARFVLRNHKLLMPSFALHLTGMKGTELECDLYFPLAPSRGAVEQAVALRFPKRGVWNENSFEISSRFPFGFTERRVHVSLKRDILIYPSLRPQPGLASIIPRLQGELLARDRGQGSEFYRLRQYEPRDSIKHINWKASARSGEIQVREFAQERNKPVAVFLDMRLTDPKLMPLFDRAVEAAAFLVYFFWKKNGQVRFRTHAADLHAPENCDLYAILKFLALAEPQATAGVPSPHAASTLEVVVTCAPERFLSAGWEASQLLGPAELDSGGADAGPDPNADTGPGANLDYGHRISE